MARNSGREAEKEGERGDGMSLRSFLILVLLHARPLKTKILTSRSEGVDMSISDARDWDSKSRKRRGRWRAGATTFPRTQEGARTSSPRS